MDPDFQDNDSFDPGVLMEASLDAQGTLTSDPRIVWQGPALVNLPIETGLSHGGMCCLLCPNVGCRVSCAVLPAIVPWVSTLSGWQMTILRTCVVSMTYTSYMVSQQ